MERPNSTMNSSSTSRPLTPRGFITRMDSSPNIVLSTPRAGRRPTYEELLRPHAIKLRRRSMPLSGFGTLKKYNTEELRHLVGQNLFKQFQGSHCSPDLPRKPSQRSILRGNSCPICYENFEQRVTKGNVVSTYCGHLFCESCLEEWFLGSNACPVCKCHTFYHQIYV